MTSRRRLKKEIDYVVSDLILDCFTYNQLFQKTEEKESIQIVEGTLMLRNELRDLTNHPERRAEAESVKSHYDNIAQTLVGGVKEGYDKLRVLIEQQKK